VPQIPDRPPAILGKGESPLPHMLEGIHTLKRAGAQAIAIACNTAHYWYDELVNAADCRFCTSPMRHATRSRPKR
jgi:aspartate racemase